MLSGVDALTILWEDVECTVERAENAEIFLCILCDLCGVSFSKNPFDSTAILRGA